MPLLLPRAEVGRVPCYSRSEAARWLGVGRSLVRRWCRDMEWDTAEGLSFLQLVETVIAVRLRQCGRSWHDVLGLYYLGMGRYGAAPFAEHHGWLSDATDVFDYDAGGMVCRWYPRGRAVPVVVDPALAFGAPQVRGVSTSNLAGMHRAGESVAFLAGEYGLTVAEVEAALSFEEG